MSPISSSAEQLDELIAHSGYRASGRGIAATEPEYRFDAERTIGALATTLAAVHRIAVQPDSLRDDADVVLTPHSLVDRATARVQVAAAEGVEVGAAYRHMPRSRLLEILADGAAAAALPHDALVLVQGRATLDNLRFEQEKVVGFEDWSGAAIADGYWDLAVCTRDLAARFGPTPIQAFFGEYGLERPDPVRLDWYLLAAELCA